MKYKYQLIHYGNEFGKFNEEIYYFKTRKQAGLARRAILKNKWFKAYHPDGGKVWQLMDYSCNRHVFIRKVEHE